MITEDTYIGLFVIFVLLTALFYGISYLFKKPDPRKGKLSISVSILIVVILIVGGFFGYIKFRQSIFDQGIPVGAELGEGKNFSWCLKEASNQFLEGSEFEAQIKIEGFVVGCLSVADDDIDLCSDLKSGNLNNGLVQEVCGTATICDSVQFASEIYCGI